MTGQVFHIVHHTSNIVHVVTAYLRKDRYSLMNTMYEGDSRDIKPIGQLLILMGLLLIGMVLATIVSIVVVLVMVHTPLNQMAAAILDPKNIEAVRVIQILSTLVLFAVPALLFAVIVNRKPITYLGFKGSANFRQFYIVLLIVIAALFTQSLMTQINELIPISKSLEIKFKQMEAEYSKEVLAMAQMKNFGDYLYALFLIALLPAVFEEMFFRGALQQTFIGLFRNAFWGILITSIFFSAAHFSFYGFLPRVFLGMVLGYVFYYGKNIWLNILMHFINNGIVVTSLYVMSLKGAITEKDLQDENYPVYIGLFALLTVFALFVFFKRECIKTALVTHDGVTEEVQILPASETKENNLL